MDKKYTIKIWCLLIPLLLFSTHVFSQNGQPFIKNYDPSEYNGSPQIWSIMQDSRDVMYFGGNDGLYQYDGVNWRHIQVGLNAAVRSMDIDSFGRIYLGSTGDFGYLEPNKSGKLEFISIAKKYLDSTKLDFSDIWTTFIMDGRAYFCSNTALFVYDKTSKDPLSIINGNFFLMYKSKGKLMVFKQPGGMQEIVHDSLIPLPGGSTFWTMFMLPYDEQSFLIGNSGDGIQVYNPNAQTDEPFVSTQNFDAEKIKTTNKFLKKNQVYAGSQINKDYYAIATIRAGIAIINRSGEIVQIIDKNGGLQSQTVHTLFVDRQLQIWAGLTYGISRLELNSPITIFNASNNLEGSIYNVGRHNQQIYASTNLGLFMLKNDAFIGVPKLSGTDAIQVFELKSMHIGNKKRLMIGATSGVWEVDGLKATNINLNTPFFLHQSNTNPNKLFGVDDGYLISFEFKSGQWSNTDTLLFVGYNAFIGVIDKQDKVWLIDNGKPAYIDLNSDEYRIDYNVGDMPDNLEINNIKLEKDKLQFLTNKGLFEFDEGNHKILKSETIIGQKTEGKSLLQITSVSDSEHWILYNNAQRNNIASIKIDKGKVIYDSISFKRLQNFESFIADGDSLMWIISPKSLFQFRMNKKSISENGPSLIRKFQVGRDSILFYGSFYSNIDNEKVMIADQTKDFIPELDFDHNNVTFEFALPFYDNENANQYKYRLIGSKIDQWSEWSNNTRKEYTNLPPGEYVFQVMARNIYGLKTKTSSYYFSVAPPWYLGWYMIILYVLLGLFTLWLIIKIYTKRLEADKKRLEKIVTERTAEIMQQKEEILTQAEYLKDANKQINIQNEELIDKNKQVTDSIQSASRIQNAMLPELENLESLLPSHFVFFQPRDIVSGDFYWIRKVNQNILIAVADCTGHGVPGAFVSMLGISLLNEIVRKKDVNSAAEVLEQMRIEVKNNLKQKGKVSDIREGIDMAFCSFNIDTNELNYAGAYNPLFLVRNGELIEYKGTRNPIGIHRFEKPFKNEYIKIESGDKIYLFSDGYIDQTGGSKLKKYKSARFKDLLVKTSEKNMKEQGLTLKEELNNWKGEGEQIDDILVVGVGF